RGPPSTSAASPPGKTPARACTSMSRCGRRRASTSTACASRPLASNGGPLRPRDAGLADADAPPVWGELLVDFVRDSGGERLEQLKGVVFAYFTDDVANAAIVDRGVDRISVRFRNVDGDVDEKGLAVTALLVVDTVPPKHLEALDLDDHSVTAAATVSASTCSRTSCTRRIVAPRS